MAKNKFKFEVTIGGHAAPVERTIAQLQNKLSQLKSEFENTEINSKRFLQLAGEIRTLESELQNARSTAKSSQQNMMDLASSLAVVGGSVASVVSHYASLINASRELENSKRKLVAASKLQGTSFEFLAKTSIEIQNAYQLNTQSANEFTIAVSKLASKAGDVGKTKQAIKSLLDLGAAQGLNAEQALVAINQALLGIDEGTDKLFQKNPMDLYKEYSKQIGVSAEKMSDAQKAQAILSALISQGSKVAGEYGSMMNTTAGRQQVFNNKLQEFSAKIGKEADSAFGNVLKALTPVLDSMNQLPSSLTATVVAFTAFSVATRAALTGLAMFNATIAASPIGTIAVAVGGLAALFQFLSSQTDKASESNRKLESQLNRAKKQLKEFGDVSKQVAADIQKESEKNKKSYEDWIEEVVKLEREIKKLKGIDVDKEIAQAELESVNQQISANEKRLSKFRNNKLYREKIVSIRKTTGQSEITDIDVENELATEANDLKKRREVLTRVLTKIDEKKRLESVKKSGRGGDESIEDEIARQKQRTLESEKKILELQPNQIAQRERIKQIEREILEIKLEQVRLDAMKGKSESEIARIKPLLDANEQYQRDLLTYQQQLDDLNVNTGNEKDDEFNARFQMEQAQRRLANSRLAREKALRDSERGVEIGSRIGGSAGEVINMMLEFNSEAARIERERKEESIRIERERLNEIKAMNEQEYSERLSRIQRALNEGQITQAEANQRFLDAEKKRSKEVEEIKRKEIDLDREQQRLRAQHHAAATAVIIANTALQFAAEYVLQYLRQTGDVFGSLVIAAGITAISGVVSSQLQGMIQQPSFASGAMFDKPTSLPFGAVVGDGRKAGSPVDMEVILNAVQLAEFGRVYMARNRMGKMVNVTIPVTVNVQTKASQYDVVLAYEESFKSVVQT